jgi:hypothetical protein
MRHFHRQIARVAGLLAIPCALSAQAATITGHIVVKGSDVGVSYSVIALRPGSTEQFTNEQGRFTLRDVRPGRVTLSVKRIGYSPLDTTISLRASETVDLRLELPLVTIQLPPVASYAKLCAHPGTPTPEMNLHLAMLFEQMKQNAERNRLLSRSYPFEMTIERKMTRPEPALEARFIAFDTVMRSSERVWRYAPGKMLGTREYAPGVFGGKWWTITMPELADFADEVFLKSHCFEYGGIDVVDGDTLLRIDFNPAESIRDPDVGGTIFLDPKTYQLRITMVSLVNLTKRLRDQVSGQAIRADFKEIIPGVPVIDYVSSVVFPRDDPKAPPTEPATETQRTLSVKFLKGRP